MIAAGPYTLEDTLDCDPFKDLLREAASLKPDLLLLVPITHAAPLLAEP